VKRICLNNAVFLLLLCLFSFICLVPVVVRHISRGVPIHYFMREPQVLGGIHPMAGAMSNLGVVIGAACAGFLGLTSLVLLKSCADRKVASFLFYSAVLTAVIVIDDMFLLHESLLPVYVGLDEEYSYLLYVLLFLCGGLIFRKQLTETDYPLLLAVFVFWGVSIAADSLPHDLRKYIDNDYRILIEDGAKWTGIVIWCGYYFKTCYHKLTGIHNGTMSCQDGD